jgi:anti-sigma factor RsiW
MSATKDQMTGRDTIEDLLPWYAAGTLSRKDSERVEQAVTSNPELARRLQLVNDEFAETILLNESLGAPSKRAMEKLFSAIDAEPARRKSASIDFGARIASFFGDFAPRTLGYVGAAAAVVIVLQAVVIGTAMVKNPGAVWNVASVDVVQKNGSLAMVRFKSQATADEITKFLSDNKAAIVDGPHPDTSSGYYTVRVSATKLSSEEYARVIKEIQKDKVVGMVLPK